MQQEVDRLVRVEVALGRQRERVDAEQGRVLALADQGLEPGDHARAPGARRLEPGEPLVERLLVDHRRHGPPPRLNSGPLLLRPAAARSKPPGHPPEPGPTVPGRPVPGTARGAARPRTREAWGAPARVGRGAVGPRRPARRRTCRSVTPLPECAGPVARLLGRRARVGLARAASVGPRRIISVITTLPHRHGPPRPGGAGAVRADDQVAVLAQERLQPADHVTRSRTTAVSATEPAACAASALARTALPVSPWSARRSEWPRITWPAPASASVSAEMSPVSRRRPRRGNPARRP